jgi:predicted CxxxxCH...CXXCH cytochrome family protein
MAERRHDGYSVAAALVVAAVLGGLEPGCLDRREDARSEAEPQRCATCHGDPERAGDALARSAPPRDLLGQTRSVFPGVGAHALHLTASSTHAAVACAECHVVPDRVDTPGHADDARPAEVSFGTLARTHRSAPRYDVQVQTCVDSYCHGSARPLWTEPKAEPCGTCHGLPPPAPHPASERCEACHGDVLDAERRFVRPELHVDGVVQYRAAECATCHGGPDNAAPPQDTLGNSAVTARGVGAHQAHLRGGEHSRALACAECHRVPEEVEEPTHVDAPPAEVALTGVARSEGHDAQWDARGQRCADTWCHSPSGSSPPRSPAWTSAETLDCASCHGAPPPAPHPQMSQCAQCHGEVTGADHVSIRDRARHVDGVVDVEVSSDCRSCHGDMTSAPPRDVDGNTATTSPGVGAHQAHVVGRGQARPVPCAECHVVPEKVLDAGHVDSARPAELRFSGAALAFGATPVYADGSCSLTSCHGAVFPKRRPSGGTLTSPSWTKVDGTQAACGSCHGLPPPPPHPLPSYPCHQCHENLASDDVSFVFPELHVDGKVTLQLEAN